MGARRSGEKANRPRKSSGAVAWLRPKVKTLMMTVNQNLQYSRPFAHLEIPEGAPIVSLNASLA
jgi:hypothetical protein